MVEQVEFDDGTSAPRNFREADLEIQKSAAEAGADEAEAMEAEAAEGEPGEPMYTVRLASVTPAAAKKGATVTGGMKHTHVVPRGMLRPGWTWRSGKWVGRWVPKVKSKRREEREAAFEKVKLAVIKPTRP